MRLRKVPGTDIKVSPICLGTMTYGTPVVKEDAIRLTHLAIEVGINFIDTANMYEGYNRTMGSPGGVAEEILGEALVGKRDKVILTTKVGNLVGDGPDDGGLGEKHVLRELEKSLTRMKTDYVDFYLAHRPDPDTGIEDVVALFDRLVKSGKVRYWGFSNFEAPDVRKMVDIARESGATQPRLSQPYYNMLHREIEADHLPACRELDIGVTAYRPLESGLLTGKYARGQDAPEGSRAAEMRNWLPLGKQNDATFEKIDTVCEMARAADVTPAQYALAWLAAQEGVTAAVVGIKTEAQVRDGAAAGEFSFPAADIERLRVILSGA